MAMHNDATISIGTWVETADDVPMRYEISDDSAALYFGPHDDCVLVMGRNNLVRMITMARNAMVDLTKHDTTKDSDEAASWSTTNPPSSTTATS